MVQSIDYDKALNFEIKAYSLKFFHIKEYEIFYIIDSLMKHQIMRRDYQQLSISY